MVELMLRAIKLPQLMTWTLTPLPLRGQHRLPVRNLLWKRDAYHKYRNYWGRGSSGNTFPTLWHARRGNAPTKSGIILRVHSYTVWHCSLESISIGLLVSTIDLTIYLTVHHGVVIQANVCSQGDPKTTSPPLQSKSDLLMSQIRLVLPSLLPYP